MKMKTKQEREIKRAIKLSKETLLDLETGDLQWVAGGLTGTCITTCPGHSRTC